MNDHNLDDLIIDNIKPKNSKTKSMLTIVALLIVLFIVAIILTSVVLKDKESNPAILETNDTEMVSPELTLQSAAQAKKEKKEPKLNEIIEEELNKPIAAPKSSVEAVKEPEAVKPVPSAQSTQPVKAVEPVKEVKAVAPVEAVKTVKTPIKVTESKSVEISKEFEQAPVNTEVTSVPKKAAEKEQLTPAPKPSVKKAPAPAKAKPAASGITYYIQVGSYRGVPSKRFLQVIKNNGFHYKITSPAANGTKKLLIGPYASRSSVDTALIRVRDLINKSAFVVKK